LKAAKAVVTGGAGFIGSHIVDELIRRKVETYVVDDLSTGTLENLRQHEGSDLLHVVVGDGRKIDKLLAGVDNIDVLYHEAAIANVLRSVKEPMVVHDANVTMALQTMNFCVANSIRRFVFASSAAVYGVIGDVKAEEGLLCFPSSPYGATKMCMENYLHAYQKTYGLEGVMLRYFNVYGPRQAMSDYSGVITLFANKILRGEPVTIYGDGRQTRDFVNVRDIVQANMLAVESDAAIDGVFNVASGNSTSILKLFEILKSATHAGDLQPTFAPVRAGDVRFGNASIERIESVLGYRTSVSMEQGLHEMLLRNAASAVEIKVQQGQRR
jgi:nucleoside-diphosphate-sugar epimerase